MSERYPRVLKCAFCDYQTSSKKDFMIHHQNCNKTKMTKKKYKCPFCPNRLHYAHRVKSLKEHALYHCNRKKLSSIQYKCTYCFYFSRVKSDLKQHISVHKCIDIIEKETSRFPTNNDQAQLVQYKRDNAKSKLKIEKLFKQLRAKVSSRQCPKCSFWTKKKYLLMDHALEHRYKFSKLSLKVKKINGRYKCPLCTFNTRNIKKHILKHQYNKCNSSNKICRCLSLSCKYGGPIIKKALMSVKKEKLQNSKKRGVKSKKNLKSKRPKTKMEILLEYSYRKSSQKVPVKMLRCCFCGYETPRKFILRQHMRTHNLNSDTQIFKCYRCTDKQKFTETFINQLPSSTMCSMCSFKTEKPEQLVKHLKSHLNYSGVLNKKKTYRCLVCQYVTGKLETFKEHVFMHLNEIPILIYKCDKCDFITNWQYMLSRHKSSHRVEAVTGSRSLRKKKNSIPKPLNNMDSIEIIDLDDYEDSVVDSQCNVEIDEEISVENISETTLISLLMKQNQEDTLFETENENIDTLKCQNCTFFATNEKELASHMFTHLLTEEPLQCPGCEFKTNRMDFYKQHKLKHIVSYKCPVCQLELPKKAQVLKHIRSHRDINLGEMYNCLQCNYSASTLEQFKDHTLQEHITDDMSFKCLKCLITYKTQKMFINHQAHHARVQSMNPLLGAVFDSPLLTVD